MLISTLLCCSILFYIDSHYVLVPFDISSSGLSRTTYELTIFIPLLIIVLLTTVFYVWGHAEKRNKDVVIDLNFSAPEVGMGGIGD